ncbi:hypothetical protein DSO57_1032006 [Entomophthora muscae]|uniref:Uncharacterized protein n=1 Tax=Entomophthora muscae TaxID=34485 RepID=A0ACC2TMV5_9FUNG|nr:hypothetical protein DSO57_1032006 [Entomophthora muscae]
MLVHADVDPSWLDPPLAGSGYSRAQYKLGPYQLQPHYVNPMGAPPVTHIHASQYMLGYTTLSRHLGNPLVVGVPVGTSLIDFRREDFMNSIAEHLFNQQIHGNTGQYPLWPQSLLETGAGGRVAATLASCIPATSPSLSNEVVGLFGAVPDPQVRHGQSWYEKVGTKNLGWALKGAETDKLKQKSVSTGCASVIMVR